MSPSDESDSESQTLRGDESVRRSRDHLQRASEKLEQLFTGLFKPAVLSERRIHLHSCKLPTIDVGLTSGMHRFQHRPGPRRKT